MDEATAARVSEEVCKIAYSESQKGLTIQDSTLTSIRQSAAVLGTLSGLVATFLGKEVLTKQAGTQCATYLWHCSTWLAIGSLVVTLALIVALLSPRNAWKLHSSASSIVDQFAKPTGGMTLADVYDHLARFNEDNFRDNEIILHRMFYLLYGLMVALSIQISAWLFALSNS